MFGYRLFHATLGLYGFVMGFLLGLSALGAMEPTWLALLLAVVAGGIGALVASLLERAAFFLGGAALGWTGGVALAGVLELWTVPVALVGTVVGGLGGLAAERLAVTAATSVLGAWLAVHGAVALATDAPVGLTALPPLGTPAVSVAVLAVVALAFVATQRRRAQR